MVLTEVVWRNFSARLLAFLAGSTPTRLSFFKYHCVKHSCSRALGWPFVLEPINVLCAYELKVHENGKNEIRPHELEPEPKWKRPVVPSIEVRLAIEHLCTSSGFIYRRARFLLRKAFAALLI